MTMQAVIGVSAVIGGFGLTTPAVRETAILYAAGHRDTARTLVGSVLTATTAPALAFTVLTIAIFPWVFNLSRLDPVYRLDALGATLLVSGTFFLSQVAAPWQTVYPALQRYDLTAVLSTLFGLASGIFGVIVLRLSPTMTSIALVGFVLAAVRLGCDGFLSGRLLGGLPRPSWHWEMVRPLMRFGGWTYLGSLGGFLFTNLDRLVLTGFLGSAAMPYYVLPQRLYSQVHTALAGQAQFLFPMFASFGQSAQGEIARLEDRLRWFVALLSAVTYTGLALAGPLLLTRLVSADYARLATLPLFLACIQGFFNAQNIVPYFNSWALGIGAPNTTTNLVNGMLVILTAVVLIPRLGYRGSSIAQLWIIPTVLVHLLWVHHHISPGASRFAWVRAYASPVMLAGVWVGSTLGLASLVPSNPVWYLFCMALGGLAGLAAVWVAENKLFRSYDRWPTLERAIAIPLVKAKRWVFAR